MNKVNCFKQKGISNIFTMVAVLLLAVSLPIAVLLVQKNQENRSSAAGLDTKIDYELIEEEGDLTDMVGNCGSADGKEYASRPTNDLCSSGSVLWKDSSGNNNGSYIWSCISDSEVDDITSMDCSAIKVSKEEGGSMDGRCGDANGTEQNSKPNSNYLLCKAGELNWIDEDGFDGEFNWSCNGLNNGQSVDCMASKIEE